MAVRSMGKGWQAEVRRYGRKVYRTFSTREEAESYVELIEGELHQLQQVKAASDNRYSAIVAVWQFAYREVQQANHGGEPSPEAVADHIAKDPRLLKMARMSRVRLSETPGQEARPWDATTLLEHFGRLEEHREALDKALEQWGGGEDDATE
jgi:hypothetical protein